MADFESIAMRRSIGPARRTRQNGFCASDTEFALRGFRVGIESTLRASARRDPHGTAHRTADGALLRFTWVGGR